MKDTINSITEYGKKILSTKAGKLIRNTGAILYLLFGATPNAKAQLPADRVVIEGGAGITSAYSDYLNPNQNNGWGVDGYNIIAGTQVESSKLTYGVHGNVTDIKLFQDEDNKAITSLVGLDGNIGYIIFGDDLSPVTASIAAFVGAKRYSYNADRDGIRTTGSGITANVGAIARVDLKGGERGSLALIIKYSNYLRDTIDGASIPGSKNDTTISIGFVLGINPHTYGY